MSQIYRTEDPTCSLTLNMVCWYDVVSFVTDYNTVSLHQEQFSPDTCHVSLDLVTPLACDLAM